MIKKWLDSDFALPAIGILWLVLIVGGSFYEPPNIQAQSGAISPVASADITGTGAAVQVFPAGGLARWVQIIAPGGNAATVRLGDPSTSATIGLPIAPGGGFLFPPLPADSARGGASAYNLSNIWVYVASGDKVSALNAR